jgi:hypothetical protein
MDSDLRDSARSALPRLRRAPAARLDPEPEGAPTESTPLLSGRLRQALLWAWLGFWLLMLLVGVQEYVRSGGKRYWEPVIDYISAAAVATAIAVEQVRRSRRLDALLRQPLRWFGRLWAWLPLLLPAFVATVYAIRHALYAVAGFPYRHAPWGEVFLYESLKFLIFFGLFTAVHFGLRSYQAWAAERLAGERQARLAQEAQLAQLTQQLHPHFLFNTLNTISALIHTRPEGADAMLTRLATLLRAATDAARRPQQSLADELALLEAYADIMLERFGDRARIEWQIDAAARECQVPTLGLQPVLENCFHHVVERRRGPTHIVVRARRSGARLQIEIEDDGDLRDTRPAYRVGLGNLERRLHALHGERARLGLERSAAGGLLVRVDLPCAS